MILYNHKIKSQHKGITGGLTASLEKGCPALSEVGLGMEECLLIPQALTQRSPQAKG